MKAGFKIYAEYKTLFCRMKEKIFWMNLAQSINILTSMAVSIAFARLTSQSVYGQFVFVLSLMSLISLVGMPGVRTKIFKSVSQGNENFYTDATKFSFLWSLVGIPFLIMLGMYFYISNQRFTGIALISSSLFFPFMYSLKNWKNFLKAKEDFQGFVLNELSISVTRSVLIIGLLLLWPQNLLLILLAYFFCTSLLNSYFFIKSLKKLELDGAEIKWRRDSYEYTLLNLTSYTFTKIDRILIGLFLPLNQVAIYDISMKIVNAVFKFIKSSIEAILPSFFKDEIKFSKFYLIFLTLFLVPLFLYPIIDQIILLLFSSNYSDSIIYARIYAFAIPFYFLSYISVQALVKEDMSREVNKSKIGSLAIFILTSTILIPKLGVLGAVASSLAYYPIQSCFCLFYFLKSKHQSEETKDPESLVLS